MKCKHEWRLIKECGFDYEYYYCIHCLARAKVEDNGKREIQTIKECE